MEYFLGYTPLAEAFLDRLAPIYMKIDNVLKW